MTGLQDFAKMLTKLDPAVGYGAVTFLVACMILAFPGLVLRDVVLGKVIMVTVIIAMTVYHWIAGIIALIVIIAMLNQIQTPNKEDMLNAITNPSSSSSVSFKTPAEFRQKYCTKEKGVPDDLSGKSRLNMTYMLNPTFFPQLDSGNPQITAQAVAALETLDNQCTPTPIDGQGEQRFTINNMCDPACNWTIKPAPSDTSSPTPTTTNAEGFTPMLRPHIRTARHVVSNGMDNLKSTANRLKRQFF